MNLRMPRIHGLFFLAIVLTSCSSVAPTRSGFLDDYGSLAPDEGRSSYQTYSEVTAPWAEIRRFVLEPVECRVESGGRDEEAAQALTLHFEGQLRSQLGRTWAPAGEDDPRAVRVRAAVTDVEAVNPLLNVASLILLWVPIDNGGASVELEILTSSGTPIYRLSAAEKGWVLHFWKGVSRHAFARSSLAELAQHVGDVVAEQTAGELIVQAKP